MTVAACSSVSESPVACSGSLTVKAAMVVAAAAVLVIDVVVRLVLVDHCEQSKPRLYNFTLLERISSTAELYNKCQGNSTGIPATSAQAKRLTSLLRNRQCVYSLTTLL